MALVSPGVEVTVIDESQYIPSAVNTVPYFLIATAQNKVSGDGVTVAAGTLAANANKTYLITSQRDLVATFGVPFFYQTTTGTPINGYELNEYGLLAAYSSLGVTNRAYIQRVNIDLTELTASLTRPTGTANNGTYWVDDSTSTWGINQWNQATSTFTNYSPLQLDATTDVVDAAGGVYTPLQSIGSIGDYAITYPTPTGGNVNDHHIMILWYKRGGATSAQTSSTALSNLYNTWVQVGTDDWKTSWPTVTGTAAPTGLTTGNNLYLNDNLVAVGATQTVAGFATVINTALNASGIYASVISGKLNLYCDSTATNDGSTGNGGILTVDAGPNNGVALLAALGITTSEYFAPEYFPGYSYQSPRWRTTDTQPEPTGSVWQNISAVNNGVSLKVKVYNSTLDVWVPQTTNVYFSDFNANYYLDPTGGGKNIPVGTTYMAYQANNVGFNSPLASFELFERAALGDTVGTGTTTPGSNGDSLFTAGNTFGIAATQAGQNPPPGGFTVTTVTIGGTGSVADFIAAVSAANVPYVSASVNSAGNIVFTHSQGGSIVFYSASPTYTGTPVATAGFTVNTLFCRPSKSTADSLVLSNFVSVPQFVYIASPTAPGQDPADGRLWYYSTVSQADIMIQDNGSWQGYQNVTNDVRGYNLSLCNAAGPIISATAPTTQTNTAQSALQYGDLWIDTSDLENYPALYRWETVSGVDQWVAVNTTDQTTENGILFADARWASNGTTDPVADPLPTIDSLLTSDYLDLDAPDPALYPQGMLLFNARRSGYNVKSFQVDYFNTTSTAFAVDAFSASTVYAYNDFVVYNGTIYVCILATTAGILPTNSTHWSAINTNTWLTASGNKSDGSMWSGRLAQRQMIVEAFKSGIDTSVAAREEQNQFNLLATPAYPELITNMIALSNERNNTCFVVGDTPMRLAADGNSLVEWSTNNNGAGVVAGDGLVSTSNYAAVFYPSCQTSDLGGNTVVAPPSHMMMRTILRSDAVSYPWLAPAGTRRGVVDNATAIGYINATTGEFVQIGVSQATRDILYEHNVNPITFIPGIGITNFGNKTSRAVTTALDRINVARLICFLRTRLEEIGKLFLFEPNDTITRNEIANLCNSLMIDLISKRAIYDYLVVCDLSNNTPARIDRNELWVDIAIEPVKAVEFIYIPLRIKNTGEIAGGAGV